MNLTGGTRGVLKGNLKRRLVSATIARVSPGEVGSGQVNLQALLTGLSGVVNVFVGCGAYQETVEGNLIAFPPASWPVGAGTIQMTPQTNFPDAPKIQFRQVFQDPTANDNDDHPLPMALPFSWNFPGECDEALIDIMLDRDVFQGTGLNIAIVLQVMIEYYGPWWDAEAFTLVMGQVNANPPSNKPLVISS